MFFFMGFVNLYDGIEYISARRSVATYIVEKNKIHHYIVYVGKPIRRKQSCGGETINGL